MCKPKDAKKLDKAMLEKIRKRLIENRTSNQVIQKCPSTCVVIYTTYNNKDYQAIGFSKVCWPDLWDAQYGIELAKKKGIAALAREIYDEKYAKPA